MGNVVLAWFRPTWMIITRKGSEDNMENTNNNNEYLYEDENDII